MSLVINHNLMALRASNSLNRSYGALSTATQRLSSGLRINSAADDAAGLAISQLMHSDVTTLNQGIRNANDAVSMIQTADAALSIIDEKLTRMKELAEQAATGTYTSDQRLIIDSEYQAMASEITRIASATDFNGIYLLNGNLASSVHNGNGLNPQGKLKVHFGTGNSSSEDYYYIQIGCCTASAFGLGSGAHGQALTFSELLDAAQQSAYNAAIKAGYSSSEATTIASSDRLDAQTVYDVAYASELNLAKNNTYWTTYGDNAVYGDEFANIYASNYSATYNSMVSNGYSPAVAAKYADETAYYNATSGTDAVIKANPPLNTVLTNPPHDTDPNSTFEQQFQGNFSQYFTTNLDLSSITGSNASIQFTTADIKNAISSTISDSTTYAYPLASNAAFSVVEKQAASAASSSLDTLLTGWSSDSSDKAAFANRYLYGDRYKTISGMTISTQDAAQNALTAIDAAIVSKDKIRAHLGALQNRLDNTISNLEAQSENLLAAESQITDVDVATEMTEYVRQQILTQCATAMLTQANSYPQLALQLIQG